MSTADRVQATLLSDLRAGALAPGTWMRQDEIATRLGVSKIPVREALHRLAGLGLLRFEPNRGAVVPDLSADDAEEIFELRRSIEPTLLERALPHLTIVDLAEAEIALSQEMLSTTEANWLFHRSLYRASGWDRGLATIEYLHAAVAPYVLLYLDELGGQTSSDHEHELLLDACRRSDQTAAVDALKTHLDHAATALIAWFRDREAR